MLIAVHTLGLGLSPAPAGAVVAAVPQADAEVSSDGRWKFVREWNGVRVYTKQNAGTSYPVAMARGDVKAPCPHVYHTVTDHDRLASFIPYVRESRILREAGHSRWVYQQLRFPGPVSDRSYVIRVDDDLSRASEGRYRLTWRLADFDGAPETGGGVRPRALSGSWILTPADDVGACTVACIVRMDPGGWIPQWFMGLAIRHYLPRVFAAVRTRAQETYS